MLILVGTPIGNLDDMTVRAVDALQNADLIASEDTRHTQKLLNHFHIDTPQISYHQHNEQARGGELVEKMKLGKTVALVTDAGMPAISDPGQILVDLCHKNHITVSVIPSPSAFVCGLAMSGLDSKKFSFEGFLPPKTGDKVRQLELIKNNVNTMIFYEAPHKLQKTLSAMLEVFGDREIAVSREITKKFEEVKRGKISELIEYFCEPKGEFVIVVEGNSNVEITFDNTPLEQIQCYINEGMDKNSAIKKVAKERNIPKREVYSLTI